MMNMSRSSDVGRKASLSSRQQIDGDESCCAARREWELASVCPFFPFSFLFYMRDIPKSNPSYP